MGQKAVKGGSRAGMSKPLVTYAREGDIALIGLNRPEKRNAISDAMIEALAEAIERASGEAKAGVIHGAGEHFCAGLDLAEHITKTPIEGIHGSRRWHAVFDRLQRGTIPFVAALTGAVVGGGLELAASTHIRVADTTAFFALPEGQRGIFVGGSGSVKVARLMSVARMTDLMLTGRALSAEEGERCNLVQYVVEAGTALTKAKELAAARRRQCGPVQLRHHQCAAAHPGHGPGRRPLRRIVDRLLHPDQPRGDRAPQGLSRQARGKGCRAARYGEPAVTRYEKIALLPPASPDAVDFGPLTGLAGFMLRLAQLQLFESFFRDFGAQGITPGQIGILVAIDRNPGVRQGVLADALHIKWSNMAKIVRLFESQGLVERRVPESDRRAVELHLTEKGRIAVDETVPQLTVSDRGATTALTARERDTLLRLLAKLARPAGAR